MRYIIVHNKHEGCYDFPYYEDEAAKLRLTSIRINPPKLFIFDNKEEAQDFFEEYINDVDSTDNRCKKGNEIEHINYCSCGIIELDEEENPILFYNKTNQIFLTEHGPQVFMPAHEAKMDIKNFNLTNKLMRKCKTLSGEQRKRYIELGKYCEECSVSDEDEDEAKNIVTSTITPTSINIPIPMPTTPITTTTTKKEKKEPKEKKEKEPKEKKEKKDTNKI